MDYGTGSVRALIVDVSDGREIGTGVWTYPHGVEGVLIDSRDPNLARQNPQDYVDGFYASVALALEEAASEPSFSPDRIIGIGVDTTGSTPIPVNAEGIPLGMTPEFADDLAGMAWLWKDHTGAREAEEITAKAKEMGRPYLDPIGGRYSSEWFWSKILKCARVAPKTFAAAYSWVEFADWVPAYLTGNMKPEKVVRGVCAAGHKALFREDWGGLPDAEFLAALDPRLAELRPRLYGKAVPSDQVAGLLADGIARRTGLPAGIPVAVGAFDAHMGAVGSGVQAGTLVKIIGTSTCDIMVGAPGESVPDIPGVCGVVDGSVLPGSFGVEAGQSAVGDLFNWVVRLTGRSHDELTDAAMKLQPGESGLLMLDWNNGNRTILVDARLTGLIVGATLGTTPAELYRTAVEATAFGTLSIIERIEENGVAVRQVVNCGGIAEKSDLVMQIYADVTNRPMKVSRSAQTPALGAALFGAVVGGAYANAEAAQLRMTGLKERAFEPRPEAVSIYKKLYTLYKTLHDGFGGVREGAMAPVMKELIDIRDRVRGLSHE